MQARGRVWIITIIITLFLTVNGVAAAVTVGEVTVIILGKPLSDKQVIIANNHLLIPLRAAAEMAGWMVDWNEAEQCAAIGNAERETSLDLRSGKAVLRGCTYAMLPPPRLAAGRIYIPLRAVGEILGEAVHWDEPTRTVIVGPLLCASGPADDTLFGVLQELYAVMPEIYCQQTPEGIRNKLAAHYAGDLLAATAAALWDYVWEGPTDYGVFAFQHGTVVQKNPLTATIEVSYTYTTLGALPAEGRLLAGLIRSDDGWRIIWEKHH